MVSIDEILDIRNASLEELSEKNIENMLRIKENSDTFTVEQWEEAIDTQQRFLIKLLITHVGLSEVMNRYNLSAKMMKNDT